MPIDLTGDDITAIGRIFREYHPDAPTTFMPMDGVDAAQYRAGLAAGRERAIEEAATVALLTPEQFGSLADDSHKECAIVAARLIRALNAASPAS